MPFLEDIALNNCKSLEYFPHIVGKMDALVSIWADDTSIKELPPSIGNLSGLDILSLRSCKSLRELPNSLFTLQNLDKIYLEGTQLGCKNFLKKLMQESQPVIRCTGVVSLELQDCCLLDEHIHVTLNLFRNLVDLNLSGNDFVSLPECLKECGMLLTLDVNNCKRLRDIPELPSKLWFIGAGNCFSLTTESLGHLWSLVFQEFDNLMAVFPATTFPDWFHNWREGGKISFLARRNFPPLAFAFELGKANNTSMARYFKISLVINGRVLLQTTTASQCNAQDHVVLLNLRRHFSPEDWRWLHRLFKELDWNDVEIQVIGDIPVLKCGVYVYQQQTNMENIQFKSPLLSTTSLKRRAKAVAYFVLIMIVSYYLLLIISRYFQFPV